MADNKTGAALQGGLSGAAAGSNFGPWGAVIGGAVGAIGGLLSAGAASGDQEQMMRTVQQAQDMLLNAGAPPDVAKQLILQQYQSMGVYSPVLEKEMQKLSSEVSKIQENQATKDIQLSALKGIQERAQGGLTAADRVAMMNIQDQMAQAAQSERAATQQSLQQRGIGGGGAEIAGMIAGGQGAMQQGAQAARGLMASQSQQALNALAQQGSMAGSIRGQDYEVAAAKARAADEMNRFNLQNQMAIQQRNVGTQNVAGMADWQNRQAIANRNVEQAITEQQRQAQAKQWAYEANMNRLRSAAGQAPAIAAGFSERAAQTRATGAGVTQGLAGIGAGLAAIYGGSNKSGSTTTTDMSPEELNKAGDWNKIK